MATELFTHPSPEQLRGFAQGRLSSAEMAELERHITHCDSCCLHLERVPDDTLVQLAREAATEGIKAPAATRALPAAKPPLGEIPKELRDHPRYRVLSLVGHGGMGAVYKAEHRKMERLVALKVINPNVLANPQAIERFAREVRAVSKLSHPNIVAVHDADDAGDLHFLVMEFVDGMSLDRVVAHNGPLSVKHAARFVRQAAEGLQHAHEKGMVHRDIKPQNLMLTRKESVKILDFGLARLGINQGLDSAAEDDRPLRPGETTAGMVLGTPDYIAPEQATDARTADGRADIYSLGCTLYYLLTGQPPFPTGSTIEKLNLHLTSAPPSIATKRSDVPAELVRILGKMLAKDPAQRYQTPGELAKDLAPLTKGQGGESRSRVPSGALKDDDPAMKKGRQPEVTPTPQETATVVTAAPADGLVPVPSTEHPVLSNSPLHDPAFAITSSPLRPVVQPTRPLQLPFGLTPPAAVGIGVGSIALLALLAWGISAAMSGVDDPQQANASSGNSHPASQTKHNPPITSPSPAIPPAATSSATPPARAGSGVIASNLPRKVLLVVPSEGLWYPDYQRLKAAFGQRNVKLDVASSSWTLTKMMENSEGATVTPTVLVNENLHATDYGAVIFAGANTWEFHPDRPAGHDIGRLLQELSDQNKTVASICVGQRLLSQHGLLVGKSVAKCPHLANKGEQIRGNWIERPVVADGSIITAALDSDAEELAETITARLSP